ncbi:iron dicitrate transport regulator FecR [Brenneria roseae subsp. roseae]|uniref:DUF4880 domain-containing protein n=1 Tax=Brenneria roseae TaxID=1509241 RepID=UPI000D605ED3|nr:DUF4880 domain-containing protein [Brenneria roseae]PWC18029.1 iron dicitrate transport regulator FecR [Brenneria roseae subsp. roseae]
MISAIKSDIPKDVFHAAAEWYATLYDEECTEFERQAWRQWLGRDETHRQAWQQVEQIHARFHAVDKQLASSVLNKPGADRRRILKLLAIASVTGGVGFSLPWESYAADYRTGTGETRELAIANGLTVWLNTDSALNQQGNGGALAFKLVQGELMLENRTAQPTTLMTAHGRIDAPQPCQIALRYTPAQSFLSVFSGEAVLRTTALTQRVTAGQQVAFTRDRCDAPVPVDNFRQSWRSGVLVADNMPLIQLIDEVSRYHHGYFHVSKQVAGLRISGVFPLHERDRLLEALVRTLPIKVTKRFAWWVDISSR